MEKKDEVRSGVGNRGMKSRPRKGEVRGVLAAKDDIWISLRNTLN